MDPIYERPRDYDLEHEGDDEDIQFYLRLLSDWQPKRVVELASGSGTVTLPLPTGASRSSGWSPRDRCWTRRSASRPSSRTPLAAA
jgi:hypothetical protein